MITAFRSSLNSLTINYKNHSFSKAISDLLNKTINPYYVSMILSNHE